MANTMFTQACKSVRAVCMVSQLQKASTLTYHVPRTSHAIYSMLSRHYATRDLKQVPFKIPQTIHLTDKLVGVVNIPTDERLVDMVDMFEAAAARGDGVGADEFKDRNDILNKILSGAYFCLFDESNDNIIALYLLYGSPIQRSENPVHNAGYVIVNPAYRSRGVGEYMMSWMPYMAQAYGFYGVLGRTGSVARTIVPLIKTDTYLVGVLPRSLKHPTEGLVDDLVVFQRYNMNDPNEGVETPELLPLKMPEDVPAWVQNRIVFPSQTLHLDKSDREVIFRSATSEDVWKVEHFTRELASQGDGFALDEFTQEGYFNKKFFIDYNVGVLTEKDNTEIMAFVMFGKSNLMRSHSAKTAHLYTMVRKEYRHLGLGTTIIKSCLQLLLELGYERVMSDVFLPNFDGLTMVNKAGFTIVGSLPDCGYMAGHGLCDSILVHKGLKIQGKVMISKL